MVVKHKSSKSRQVYAVDEISEMDQLKQKNQKVLDDPSPRFHQQRRPTYFLRTHVWLTFSCMKSD